MQTLLLVISNVPASSLCERTLIKLAEQAVPFAAPVCRPLCPVVVVRARFGAVRGGARMSEPTYRRFSMVVECLASHDFPCAPGVVGYARDELGWGDGDRRTARQGGVRYR
jgi:hypothetical protein